MIIGIGGVKGAGKRTLAESMRKYYKDWGRTVDVFHQEDYQKSKVMLPKVEGVPDSERPNTVKWDSLTKALEKSSADVKIVEGQYIFYPASLRAACTGKVMVEVNREVYEARREHNRKEDEPDWYTQHIWKSYQKYGQVKGDADGYISVPGDEPFEVGVIASKIEGN